LPDFVKQYEQHKVYIVIYHSNVHVNIDKQINVCTLESF